MSTEVETLSGRCRLRVCCVRASCAVHPLHRQHTVASVWALNWLLPLQNVRQQDQHFKARILQAPSETHCLLPLLQKGMHKKQQQAAPPQGWSGRPWGPGWAAALAAAAAAAPLAAGSPAPAAAGRNHAPRHTPAAPPACGSREPARSAGVGNCYRASSEVKTIWVAMSLPHGGRDASACCVAATTGVVSAYSSSDRDRGRRCSCMPSRRQCSSSNKVLFRWSCCSIGRPACELWAP